MTAGSLSVQLALLCAAGLASGFVNVMAGGGSLLTLPALMALGMPAEIANGTNRLSVVSQSASGVWGFHRAGRLHTRAIAPVLLATAPGSLLGALAASYAPRAWLKPALLVALIAMAFVTVMKPEAFTADPSGETRTLRERPVGTLGLFAAGLYGGFVQAGVGFALLAVLAGVLRYDLLRANALKLACTLAFGIVGLSVFALRGQVTWVPAVVLALATTAGSLLGVRFTLKVNQEVLRWVLFGAVMAVCAAALARA